MGNNRKIYQVNGKTFQAKIDLDKYYTPIDTAEYCINKTYEIIGRENITEIIEPSAGDGSFSLQIPNCIAIDIEPQHESITKQDFFTLHLPYKKGRLIIGNPPFGRSGNLAIQFYKHSIQMAEYVSFILPAGQYNNTYSCYEYDLIYSELINCNNFIHLNDQVKLTFNIYKNPMNGFNKRKKYKFEDFELYLITLKNKIYKLLPLKEEHLDWSKYLNTVIVEVSGLNELFDNQPQLISLLAKLEGLYRLEDFMLYRRTIFECLNIVEDLR